MLYSAWNRRSNPDYPRRTIHQHLQQKPRLIHFTDYKLSSASLHYHRNSPGSKIHWKKASILILNFHNVNHKHRSLYSYDPRTHSILDVSDDPLYDGLRWVLRLPCLVLPFLGNPSKQSPHSKHHTLARTLDNYPHPSPGHWSNASQ